MSDPSEAYEAIRKEIACIREELGGERLRFSTAVTVDEALCSLEAFALDLFLALKKDDAA